MVCNIIKSSPDSKTLSDEHIYWTYGTQFFNMQECFDGNSAQH